MKSMSIFVTYNSKTLSLPAQLPSVGTQESDKHQGVITRLKTLLRHILHPNFIVTVANAMAKFQDSSMCQRRRFLNISLDKAIHSLTKFPYSVPFYYCQHESHASGSNEVSF